MEETGITAEHLQVSTAQRVRTAWLICGLSSKRRRRHTSYQQGQGERKETSEISAQFSSCPGSRETTGGPFASSSLLEKISFVSSSASANANGSNTRFNCNMSNTEDLQHATSGLDGANFMTQTSWASSEDWESNGEPQGQHALLKLRRDAICEEIERGVTNEEGVSLRHVRKLISARHSLRELNVL